MSQEVQQKYMELQLMQHQVQQVQQQVKALESQAEEMDTVLHALDEFSRAEMNSGMFVTLTPGLFVNAELKNNKNVLLNVGSGAMVEKTIPEAKKLVEGQTIELRKLQQELAGQMQKLVSTAEKTQEELVKLLG